MPLFPKLKEDRTKTPFASDCCEASGVELPFGARTVILNVVNFASRVNVALSAELTFIVMRTLEPAISTCVAGASFATSLK